MSDGLPGGIRTVAVFGSSRLTPDEPEYAEARELGRALALAGWTPMTGGYDGVMAAVSAGACEAGGAPIGVTVAPWSRRLRANRWVADERPQADVFDRLRVLLGADAMVAVAGGVGTLAEVALAWNIRQREPAGAPLILMGPRWRALSAAFASNLIDRPQDAALIHLARDPAEVIALLAARFG